MYLSLFGKIRYNHAYEFENLQKGVWGMKIYPNIGAIDFQMIEEEVVYAVQKCKRGASP